MLARGWILEDDGRKFHVKVAESLEEACKLLEVGFEYVTDMENKKLFRKRKWKSLLTREKNY